MDYEINKKTFNGITMRYMKFGNGKDTMVILPGLAVKSVLESADAIANQYKSMTQEFTIYLFDRRENIPDVYSVKDMAEDTAGIMTGLGLESVFLFGASQGGMMALVIAARYPELVRKLALGSTCARFDPEEHPAIGSWVDLARKRKGPELFLDFARQLYPPEVTESLTDFLVSTGNTVTEEEFKRFIAMASGTSGFDITDEISSIRCSVLILGSEDDAVVGPEGSREIFSLLSQNGNAELYMYDGYGHAAFDTAEDYRDRLSSFFKAKRTE